MNNAKPEARQTEIQRTIMAHGVGHAVPKRKFRTGCIFDAESLGLYRIN